MSVKDILEQVERFKARYVCVTGGEPLLQACRLSVDGASCAIRLPCFAGNQRRQKLCRRRFAREKNH